MRFITVLLVLFMCLGTFPAAADWERVFDGTDSTVAKKTIGSSNQALYHHFTTIDDSTGLFIQAGYEVEVCLNANDGSPTKTGNLTKVWLLHGTHIGGVEPGANHWLRLFNIELDGTGSPSGVTNDCHYTVDGPRWIMVDVTVAPDNNGAYVSVIVRPKKR